MSTTITSHTVCGLVRVDALCGRRAAGFLEDFRVDMAIRGCTTTGDGQQDPGRTAYAMRRPLRHRDCAHHRHHAMARSASYGARSAQDATGLRGTHMPMPTRPLIRGKGRARKAQGSHPVMVRMPQGAALEPIVRHTWRAYCAWPTFCPIHDAILATRTPLCPPVLTPAHPQARHGAPEVAPLTSPGPGDPRNRPPRQQPSRRRSPRHLTLRCTC